MMFRPDSTTNGPQPIWLSDEEMADPQSVLDEFVSYYHLPECRFYGWEMFTASLDACDQSHDIDFPPSAIHDFAGSLFCVFEALHLLAVKKDLPTTQAAKTDSCDSDPKTSAREPEHSGQDEALAAIITMICGSMEVERIFLLGKYPLLPAALGEEYDLLVLVKNDSSRPMDELESYVQNRSQELAPVHATVMKSGKVMELLKAGNWYFSRCCAAANLVYNTGNRDAAEMPAPVKLPEISSMEPVYSGLLAKAAGFLNGARQFYEKGEYALCCFMLHQAMEHGINALLVPLMQFRFKTHNLHKLLRFLRRFNGALYDIFPRDTEWELTLFQLLQRAYIHARYKDSFTVQEGQAAELLARVSGFIEQVPKAFRQASTGSA